MTDPSIQTQKRTDATPPPFQDQTSIPRRKRIIKQLKNGIKLGHVVRTRGDRLQVFYRQVIELRPLWPSGFWQPNVVMQALEPETDEPILETSEEFGMNLQPLTHDFYQQRKQQLLRELEDLETAWQLQREVLQAEGYTQEQIEGGKALDD